MLHSNFDVYYNVSVSEYSLRKNANENNITYESAIKMKLRFLLDAITYWELVEFKEMVERTFDSIVKVKNMMHKSEINHKQDISDDAVFDPVCVRGSIDGMRKSGPLTPGYPGHPKDLHGFTVICGLDPAMVGDTAAVCYAIDRTLHKRYIVDAIKITRPTPAQIS